MSLLGCHRKAKNIDFRMVFGEENGESLSEHPFSEEASWLRSGCDGVSIPEAGFYLLEGDETWPVRLWRGSDNNIEAFYVCIWEKEEEDG